MSSNNGIIIYMGLLGSVLRAFTYIGGKSKMVEWLFKQFPDDFTLFVDCCGGSGSVSLSLNPPPTCREVILNDFDPTIHNFYETLKGDRGKELEERLLDLEYTKVDWYAAHSSLLYYPTMDDVEAAVSTYTEIISSFSSMRKGYVKKDVGYLLRSTQNNIPKAREKLQNITITNDNFINILKATKDPKAFLYIDVPYRMTYRCGKQLYKMEISEIVHFEMLEILKDAPYRWALSGYSSDDDRNSNDLYDCILSDFAQYRVEYDTYKFCGSGKEKTRQKEILWRNYGR